MLYFVRAQMLGRIVLPSTFALPFHIALVFLRVPASLLKVHTHTQKNTFVVRECVKKCKGASNHVGTCVPLLCDVQQTLGSA